jgi:hypothetical protein
VQSGVPPNTELISNSFGKLSLSLPERVGERGYDTPIEDSYFLYEITPAH